MSKEIKTSVVVDNSIPEAEFKTDFILSPTVKTAKVATLKTLSPVAQARKTVIQTIDGNVKSLSSYFKEFRKNHENLQKFIIEAQVKGRRFDGAVIHDIVNNGKLSLITEQDDIIQAAKEKKAVTWSGTRLFTAFLRACEIKSIK